MSDWHRDVDDDASHDHNNNERGTPASDGRGDVDDHADDDGDYNESGPAASIE